MGRKDSVSEKYKAIRELSPLTTELNKKIREIIVDRNINLNIYISRDEELLGRAPVIVVDVFKRNE